MLKKTISDWKYFYKFFYKRMADGQDKYIQCDDFTKRDETLEVRNINTTVEHLLT